MTSVTTARRRAVDRLGPRGAEVARFLVTGGAAYAVDLGVFNLLILGTEVGSLTAKVVSSVFAIAVAFAGSRWFTWRDRRSDRVVREYSLFVLFSVLAAGIQYLCLLLTHEVIGWTSPLVDNLSANVVGMALAMAFRFWTFRTFVFPAVPQPPRGASDGGRNRVA